MTFRAFTSIRLALASSALLLSGAACQNVEIVWDSDLLGDPASGEPRLVFDVAPSSMNVAGADFSTQPAVALKQGAIPDPTFAGAVKLSVYSDAECKVPSAVSNTWTQTASAANLGVVSFASINLTVAGTYYFKATSGNYASACSASFTIQPLAASTLAFDGTLLSTIGTNVPFSPQPSVIAKDIYGNVATGYTSQVSISPYSDSGCLTMGGGVLSANTGLPTAGKASFAAIAYNATANIYLRAIGGGLQTACSSMIAVTIPPPDHLAFGVAPAATATAGVSFSSMTVRVEDGANALVTSYSNILTINAFQDSGCLSPAPGTMSGNMISPVSGVSTFATTNYTAVGNIYLKAISTSYQSACVGPTTLVAGAVSSLVFATAPSTPNTAGISFGTQPVVSAVDINNNVNPTFGTVVTLSAYSNPGCSTGTATLNNSTATPSLGSAAFSSLNFTTPTGSLYLKATSGGGVFSSCIGPLTVNTGAASQLTFTTAPSTTNTAGSNFLVQPVIAAKDSGGNTVTSFSGVLTISAYNDAGCASPSSGTISAFSAPLSLGIFTVGNLNYTKAQSPLYLKATSTGIASNCQSAGSVIAGAAHHLAITTNPPATVTVGAAFSTAPVVTAVDVFDNTVTSYAALVTATTYNSPACGGGAAPGSFSSSPIATMTTGVSNYISLIYQGPSATVMYLGFASGGLISACGATPITLVAGAPNKLAFMNTPTTAIVGAPVAPTIRVQVQDLGSNPVSSSASITLTISSGGGVISNNISSAVAGVAEFASLSATTASLKMLQAAASGLTSVTSSGITFVSGQAPKIVASSASSCSVRSNGATYCWGDNSTYALGIGKGDIMNYLQASTVVPATSTPINLALTTLASFGDAAHYCGIDAGNNVQCWGLNEDGQLGDGIKMNRGIPRYVLNSAGTAALSSISQVAVGTNFSCAVAMGGAAVYCWGGNGNGQLGNGTYTDSPLPVLVTGLSGTITKVTAGLRHACALNSSGQIYCWGANAEGQLGDSTTTPRASAALVKDVPGTGILTGATDISAGWDNTCAVVSGSAFCWGDNIYGELGMGSIGGNYQLPKQVKNSSNSGSIANVVSVSAGVGHSCFVAGAGPYNAYCTGNNSFGQLGNNTTVPSGFPILVSSLSGSSLQIAAGDSRTCANTPTLTKCWGYGSTGGVGDTTSTDRHVPTTVSGVSSPTALAVSLDSACARVTGGYIKCWGTYGSYGGGSTILNAGQIPEFTGNDSPSAINVMSQNTTNTGAFSLTGAATWIAGGSDSLGFSNIDNFGSLTGWGENSFGQLGIYNGGAGSYALGIGPRAGNVAGMFLLRSSISARNGCAIDASNSLYCWGDNSSGQLGDGTTTADIVPTAPVGGLPAFDMAEVGVSGQHACGITLAGGNVWCWGSGLNGTLGNGTTTSSMTPVQISSFSSAKVITAGPDHNCVVKTDGTVWCWGLNDAGQIGDGSTSPRYSPVQVSGVSGVGTLQNIVSVQVGIKHSCALDKYGFVYCWGLATSGAMGDGQTATNRTSPVQVRGVGGAGFLGNIIAIASGGQHVCASTSGSGANSVFCWGSGSRGQVGDNSSSDRSLPVAVIGLP